MCSWWFTPEDSAGSVLHILVLTTSDRERATDATQEAFIKAYAKWSKIRRCDSSIAWVGGSQST